jgi:hypothetical protein
MKPELDVLVEQLDELLGEGVVDTEDALELAIVAGLAARLGAGPALADADAWRVGPGAELVAELWDEVDADALVEAIDEVSGGSATDEEVEEALFDFDDLVAAALWCRKPEVVRAAARKVEALIRQVPDPFAPVADLAGPIARLPAVAEHLDLYGYWLAVSDAGVHRS